MKLSRRGFLEILTKMILGMAILGLSFSGYFLKKGAPERVYSRASGEVRITKLADLHDPGTVKFMAGEVPGILVHFKGQLRAFSASCTHMGCPVSGRKLASEGLLVCPCHGSTYDPMTGERLSGPAPRPLPEIRIEVRDDVVYAVI